jgi:hypothetical protein
MPDTINTAFDPTSLPAWARRNPNVVALAARNLAYRVNVCAATTEMTRRLLTRRADAEAAR